MKIIIITAVASSAGGSVPNSLSLLLTDRNRQSEGEIS